MTSPERRKGSGWERAIVAYLREHGFPFAERAYGAGRPDDVGDVAGLPGWCLEAKNARGNPHKCPHCGRQCRPTLDLASWADEAAKEAENARCPWWAVIAKRRNRPAGDAYVVMSLAQFAELLAEDENVEGRPHDIVVGNGVLCWCGHIHETPWFRGPAA